MIETKVTWSTIATLAASIAVVLLNAYAADSSLIPGVPAWLQGVLILIVPTLVTFLSGYTAPHTARPDLPKRGPNGQFVAGE
jgi:hypothetical protein